MVTERLSAGFIIVRRAPEGWRYLLLRCFRYWDFAKGELDPGETPLAAAQREVAEETGLSGLELAWGRDYYQTEPYRGGKRARYYLALSRDGEVVLGVSPDASDAEVKKAYRRLMSQHHPDKLASKGLPEEMMQLAKEKTQEIKSAYEQIKGSRA